MTTDLKPVDRVRILTRPYYSPSLKQMQRATTGTVERVSLSGCFVVRDGNKTASRFRPTDIEPLGDTA